MKGATTPIIFALAALCNVLPSVVALPAGETAPTGRVTTFAPTAIGSANPRTFQINIETDMEQSWGNDPVKVFLWRGGQPTVSKAKSLPVTYTAGDQMGVQVNRWYWSYDAGGLATELAGSCPPDTFNANKNPDNSGSQIYVNSDCTLERATLPVYGIGFPSYMAADFKLEIKSGVCTLSISSVAGLTDELATQDSCVYPCVFWGKSCTPAQLHETVGCGKLVAGDYTAAMGQPITDFSQVSSIRHGLVQKCAP